METLKYAILGLLMKKDMTGYELSKESNSEVFEFWNASHSQIYPQLQALTIQKRIIISCSRSNFIQRIDHLNNTIQDSFWKYKT